ncbi:MAG TPA: MFS transporter [Candidatus Merdivicinus intestinigallinarum]|nr:MFS transporter [Candidatus Merdivicinus intestinigallinarum]
MYREILKNADYRKLLLADVINRFGDSVDAVAFTWLTYQFSQSASLSALTLAANRLPTVIFQPLFSPIADRLPKKPVMAVCDFIRAALVGIFLLLYLTGSLQAWMFLAFSFVMNTVESFRIPAGVGMLPKLVGKEEYKKASSLMNSVCMVADLAGTGLAGLIIALSMGAAFGVDLLTFVLSGLLILGIRFRETIAPKEEQKGYFAELKGGFQYLGKNQLFLLLVMGAVLFNSVGTILGCLMVPYISDVFRGGSMALSMFGAAQTAGMLLAFYFYPKISEKISYRVQFLAGYAALAAGYAALTVFPALGWFRYLAAGLFMFAWGGVMGITNSFFSIQFVRIVEPDYLGRAAAVFNSAGACIDPLMSVLVAGLAALLSIQVLFAIAAAAAAVVLVILSRLKLCYALNEKEKPAIMEGEQHVGVD